MEKNFHDLTIVAPLKREVVIESYVGLAYFHDLTIVAPLKRVNPTDVLDLETYFHDLTIVAPLKPGATYNPPT